MAVIRWVSNFNNNFTSLKQLQASYTDVIPSVELIDCIENTGGPQVPYSQTSGFICTLPQDELDIQCMGLCTKKHLINDPMYAQILYNCWLSNAAKLDLGHSLTLFFAEK